MLPTLVTSPSITRRGLLRSGLVATAASAVVSPMRVLAQAVGADPLAQMRAPAATTPITTTKLLDNLYLLQGTGGNMALQTGSEGNILIDSSYAPAVPRILAAIKAVSGDQPDVLINTHWHVDHVDGNEGVHQAGYKIVAHTKTRDRLAQPSTIKLLGISLPAYPAAAWPTLTFDSTLKIWHNGDSLHLEHFAPAHTDTDIFIHFEKANVLHLGDIWFNGSYPFIDESSGGNIGGMITGAAKGLALADSSTKIIPGHGPLGTKAELQRYHDVLSDVRDKVAGLKAKGMSESDVVAAKPSAQYDDQWGKGFMNAPTFLGIVYRTV